MKMNEKEFPIICKAIEDGAKSEMKGLRNIGLKITSDTLKEYAKSRSNNWRKTHHLPMIRRKGKRK